MTTNGQANDDEGSMPPLPPRPRDRLSQVETGLELVRLSVQDLAQLVGTLVAATTRLEGAVSRLTQSDVQHRERLASVPDFVEEVTQRRVVQVIEHQELDLWRKRAEWSAKIIATVLAGAILLYLGRFIK